MRDVFVCSHDSMWHSLFFGVEDRGDETNADYQFALGKMVKKKPLTVQRTTNFYYEPYCNALSIRLSVNNFDMFSNIIWVKKKFQKNHRLKTKIILNLCHFRMVHMSSKRTEYQNASHTMAATHRLLNFLTCQQFCCLYVWLKFFGSCKTVQIISSRKVIGLIFFKWHLIS